MTGACDREDMYSWTESNLFKPRKWLIPSLQVEYASKCYSIDMILRSPRASSKAGWAGLSLREDTGPGRYPEQPNRKWKLNRSSLSHLGSTFQLIYRKTLRDQRQNSAGIAAYQYDDNGNTVDGWDETKGNISTSDVTSSARFDWHKSW